MVIFKKALVVLLLCTASIVKAQSDSTSRDEWMIFAVESMPHYSGGVEKLQKFIQSQIKYDSLVNFEREEIVYISCWVDTVGNTHSHTIMMGFRDDLDQEALRVSRLIRFAKPAKQGGKPVEVKYFFPIRFKLKTAIKG
jgi:protein TonB